MKAIFLSFTLFFSISVQAAEFGQCSNLLLNEDPEEIKWYDLEKAVDLCEEEKRPIFIDIYTGWCGWCKKMDAGTFKDEEVVQFMNEHYYAVKMDAESKEPIAFKEVLYEYKVYNGKTGYNELAVNLLGGSMSFPSFVILSKRQVKLKTLKGYKKPKELMKALEKYANK